MSLAESLPPTNEEKIRLLPWSVASNAANMVFVQYTFFGSAFVLFLSELGLNTIQIGLLLSFFPFFGLIALFIAPAVARNGYKRTFLTFYGARKVITAFLLFTPWMGARFGGQLTLYFIMAIVLLVALCRAISETALFPWSQEYVPNSIRGKFSATTNIVSNLTGVVATSIGGLIIGSAVGLERFMVLIGIGVLMGFVSVWTASFRPGGAPVQRTAGAATSIGELRNALRDKNLRNFLFGLALVTLATVPMFSFIPVFMEDVVRLNEGAIVWLQTAAMIGGLTTTFLWGWATDRYGGKPVMLTAVVAQLLLPLGWLLMPIGTPLSLPVALVISIVQGMATVGWAIGSGRLLYVGVVPPDKNNEYMALYYAAVGIVGGVSQWLGGWLLALFDNLSGQIIFIQLNPHTPLYLLGLGLLLFSLWLFRGVRADSPFSLVEFANLFLHGNPFVALVTMPRYYWAKDEETAISMTARLGRSQSRLTVEELLDALIDPRFNVRFEAVIAIARMTPEPRLVQALIKIVEGTELSLSVVAAWALGRMGGEEAIPTLRQGLDSEYRSIRAHSARALGAVDDRDAGPLLLSRLAQETDKGLQMAYASTLGKLRMKAAAGQLVNLLDATHNPGARLELALSLARLVDEETYFVGLLRGFRTDASTTTAQALRQITTTLPADLPDRDTIIPELEKCRVAFAREQTNEGVQHLYDVLLRWPRTHLTAEVELILDSTLGFLAENKDGQMEYILLALLCLHVGW
ncbi:MAG: MFS transporter [Ardenticatenaceae bacterium]|nr:MFS transporter [Ardenticatenaceae bacterium]